VFVNSTQVHLRLEAESRLPGDDPEMEGDQGREVKPDEKPGASTPGSRKIEPKP
jgi:hypothetical protein